MVRGLDEFRKHFADHQSQFVLIGGTAATLAMESAGLDFRATKDLDIVLHIEALDPGFGIAFWSFVERGGYELRQASDTGKPVLYRFQKPKDAAFPAMLELFCRSPDGIKLAPGSQLTPIPIDEAISSLSAILLDDTYYAFIIEGRRNVDQLSWIGEEQLIPLKARAWLDLTARKASGESIDTKAVRKHALDVVRLSQLLTPESQIELDAKIAAHLSDFLSSVAADASYDPKSIQIPNTLDEILARVARFEIPRQLRASMLGDLGLTVERMLLSPRRWAVFGRQSNANALRRCCRGGSTLDGTHSFVRLPTMTGVNLATVGRVFDLCMRGSNTTGNSP